jgi:uncharacterized membrane protein YedE/YeeE
VAVIALLIGVAFGITLERAGLGNARKLTAQFYLTDLTVFKVMFTAIVTAMLGLTLLAATGTIDLAAIEPSPTWLLPQLAGGLLFGVGFVMGGYCPGTSCVAAASGRLDGLATVLGLFAGVFVFGEVFGLLRGFYDTTPLGTIGLHDVVGLPRGVVVALVALLAGAGFVVAERIERRASPAGGV